MGASLSSFSSLLFLLGITINTIAAFTFPLVRIGGRTGVNPPLHHRQNDNRGLHRLTQLTGRSEPAPIEGGGPPSGSIHPRAVGQGPIGGPETDNSGKITRGKETTTANSLPLHVLGADDKYLFTTYIGTPARPFLMAIDFISGYTWAPGENCVVQPSGSCGIHQYLGSTSSATFKDDPSGLWSWYYYWGPAGGHAGYDNITVAGVQLDTYKLGVGTYFNKDFASDAAAFDGIVGFASTSFDFYQSPGIENPTLVEALASTTLISAAIVSFKFPRVSDGLNDGEVKFGGLNPSKYIEGTDVVLINTDNKGLWSAPIDSVTINQQDIGIRGHSALFDISRPGLQMPLVDVKAIHKQIPGAIFVEGTQQYLIPCLTKAVLELKFGARSFPINSRDLASQPIDGTYCQSSIVNVPVNNPNAPITWVVGAAFLKNVYFSLNYDKNTITLAELS